MFQVGDKVVHPMHGAGVIDKIVEERISGRTQMYYVFSMPVSGLVLKIPTSKSHLVGLRSVMDAASASAVIGALDRLDTGETANWNKRYRENLDRLKSGDLYEVARVIKCLMRRDAERGLSTGERKMLHSAKQIFLSEMVLATGESYQTMESRLCACMQSGPENEEAASC